MSSKGSTKRARMFERPAKATTTPWGWWHVIAEGVGWKIKLLYVAPNQRTSLQMHFHREEWVQVLEGEALFLCGDKRFTSSDGPFWMYIPAEKIHRITGLFPDGVLIGEMQRSVDGEQPAEDDIRRIEDDYGRTKRGR